MFHKSAAILVKTKLDHLLRGVKNINIELYLVISEAKKKVQFLEGKKAQRKKVTVIQQ